MIYRREAIFPYPVLTSSSSAYVNPYFNIEIGLDAFENQYLIKYKYKISSLFINNLIESGKANIYLVIQTKDSKCVQIDPKKDHILIRKNRISIKNRTEIQMFIVASDEINFSSNQDLSEFYSKYKNMIVATKNSLLAYSNVVTLEGRFKQHLKLFETHYDQSLESEIKIDFGYETIVIHYRDKDFFFSEKSNHAFNNLYIYTALNKALTSFLLRYKEKDEDFVNVSNSSIDNDDLIGLKLRNLMSHKGVENYSIDEIDQVITKISDRIIEKYSAAVKRVVGNGD